jgi:hypothetical protein
MPLPNSYYLQFAKNIYTQCGEDGIIEQLFKDLKITSGIVVEFGAWDGLCISNVLNLWKNKKFKAILIECDMEKYKNLDHICGKIDSIECLNYFVNPDANHKDSLDNILTKSKFKVTSSNLALVSIDVDTCDYYIFESMAKYLPKVIVIETNTNYGPTEEYVSNNGSSLRSITELAEKKGYTLVCHTGNAFYIRNDLIEKLPQEDYSIENLFVSTPDVSIMQAIGPDGNDYGSLYWLSDEYNQNIQQIKKELLNE